VKQGDDFASNLAGLIDEFRAKPPAQQRLTDPIDVLVYSFLLWERSSPEANEALDSLRANLIDYNDLRVSLPYEIAAILPPGDPMAEVRSSRLRAVLNNIYRIENEVSLASLDELGKRDARKYLDALDGMVPFVASRVGLLCFGSHAVPLDERLRMVLIARSALDPAWQHTEAASWLARQIKAAEASEAHAALQSASDALHVVSDRRRARTRRGASPSSRRSAPAAGTESRHPADSGDPASSVSSAPDRGGAGHTEA